MPFRNAGAGVIAAVVFLTGCETKPPAIGSVTGRVTLDGKPVTAGIVTVGSDDGVTRVSAEIGPDGRYAIIGAPVGRVRVAVATAGHRETAPEPGAADPQPRRNPRFVAVPAKYESTDTSELTATVGPGRTDHDIELRSK